MEPPEIQNLRRRLQAKLVSGEIDKPTYDRMVLGLAGVGGSADKLSAGMGVALADPFDVPLIQEGDPTDEYGVTSFDGNSSGDASCSGEAFSAAQAPAEARKPVAPSRPAMLPNPSLAPRRRPPIGPGRTSPNWQVRRMRRLVVFLMIVVVLPLAGFGVYRFVRSGQSMDNLLSWRSIVSLIEQKGHSAPVFTSVGISQEEIREHFQKGNDYRDRAAFADAIQEYTKAIELDPDYQEAFFWRAYAKLETGEPGGAIQDYSEAIRLHPDNPHAFNNRGLSHQMKGNWADAARDYTRAIELDPRFALACFNRGVVRHAQGQLDDALKDYTEAIGLNPKSSAAYNNRGLLHLAKGNRQEAIKDFDRAVQLKSDCPLYLVNRARVRGENREYDKALNDIAGALRLQPNNEEALQLQSAILKEYTVNGWK